MPGHLILFRSISLPLAADDLAIPCFVGTLLRIVILAGAIAILVAALLGTSSSAPTTCASQPAELAFFALIPAISVVILALYVLTTRAALHKSILDYKERTVSCNRLLNSLSLAYVGELGLMIFGLILWVPRFNSPLCSSSATTILLGVASLGLACDMLAAILATAILTFLAKMRLPGRSMNSPDDIPFAGRVARVLLSMLSTLCCGMFGTLSSPAGQDDLIWREIAMVVSSFMGNMTNHLVLTDFVAAMALVRAEQRYLESTNIRVHEGRALSMDIISLDGTSRVGSSAAASSPIPSPPKSPQRRTTLKVQTFPSSTPVSANGSWVSQLLAIDGRVASKDECEGALEALKDAASFCCYANGIYGWMLQLYAYPTLGLRHLCSNVSRMLCCKEGTSTVEKEVFQSSVGMTDPSHGEVLYASFTTYMGEAVPYTICLDHIRKAVVVTCRGTLSVGDICTDLACEPQLLDLAARQWGFEGTPAARNYAHGGMLRVAMRIREDIERQEILHKLFKTRARAGTTLTTSGEPTDQDRDAFFKIMRTGVYSPMFASEAFVGAKQLDGMEVSSYRLIVTGHSLGACMASILTVLLKPAFPDVRCMAFSPAAAIFSRELADESEAYINSVVVGKDIFGRLSWRTAKDLRDRMLESLWRCKVDKTTVLASLVRKEVPSTSLMYDKTAVPAMDDFRLEMKRLIQDVSAEQPGLLLDKVPMFIPGRVLHLTKTHTERTGTCCGERVPKYTPMWVRNRADMGDVQFSSRMILDHMPDYVEFVIKGVLSDEMHFLHDPIVGSPLHTMTTKGKPAGVNGNHGDKAQGSLLPKVIEV